MKHIIAAAVIGSFLFTTGTQQSHAVPTTEYALLFAVVPAGPAPGNLTSKPNQNQKKKVSRKRARRVKK